MATGLVTETGALIPIVRGLLLRLTPVLRSRELQRRLAMIELDRGGSVLTAGRRLLGTGAAGQRVAAVFDAAAAEAMAESPALAAELLTAAVDGGHRPPLAVAGRRAYASALAGDLDRALQLADQVIADPAAPDRAARGDRRGHRAGPPRPAGQQRRAAALPARGAGRARRAAAARHRGAGGCPRACWTRACAADGPGDAAGAGAATLLAGGMLTSVAGSGAGGPVPAGPGRGAARAGRAEHACCPTPRPR